MKDALFIYNPNSGQKIINDYLPWIVDYLSEREYLPVIYATQSSGDARNIILEYGERFEEILVSGGDGTLDEVLSAVVKLNTDPLIGYIPTGSTNDFSKSLNIPAEVEKATKVATRGYQRRIDIGQIDEKYFVYVAAFGTIAEVSYSTGQDIKNIFGRSAYIFEGLKQTLPLVNIPTYKIHLDIDGEEIEGEFIHFMITNSVSVGGFVGITGENVRLSDGIFELTMVKRPNSLADINKIIFGITNREENDMLILRQGSDFKITTDQKVAWSLDGEYGGSTNFAHVRVKKECIKMRTGLR